jgi:hypothetical protein
MPTNEYYRDMLLDNLDSYTFCISDGTSDTDIIAST